MTASVAPGETGYPASPARIWLLRLLGFRFRRVSIFLLLLQVVLDVGVRGRRWGFARRGLGIGRCRQSVLTLLVGQFLEPGIHLDAQLVMHLLQVVNGHAHLCPHRTLVFLAAFYRGVDHLVIVRSNAGSVEHVARG